MDKNAKNAFDLGDMSLDVRVPRISLSRESKVCLGFRVGARERCSLSLCFSLSPLSRVSIRPLAGCNVFEAFAIAKGERSKLPPPFFAHLHFV
jgi:hypothetical protein